MERRYFLKQLAGLPILFVSPIVFSRQTKLNGPLVILIELKGGNDGLNTIIPYNQPAYYTLRPTLAIPKESALPIGRDLAMNPNLVNLHRLFEAEEAAVLQSVGYPKPNFSHFRSRDIWMTASDSEDYIQTGWLSHLIERRAGLKGLIFSDTDDLGPFEGLATNIFSLPHKNMKLKLKTERLQDSPTSRPALRHLIAVNNQIVDFEKILDKAKKTKEFSSQKDPFYAQTRRLISFLSVNSGVSLFQLKLSGFDTHGKQAGKHRRLLARLDKGIAYLERKLKELNLWDQTLILTHSEFGRKALENKNRGTDHGAGNVHFALGGLVKPGIYGQTPVLSSSTVHIPYRTDFRSVYSAILNRVFSLSAVQSDLVRRFSPLDFINSYSGARAPSTTQTSRRGRFWDLNIGGPGYSDGGR